MSQFRATPSCPWPLLSKKDVEEASPSRKEGMTYAKEMSFVRSMCELMKKIGERAAVAHTFPNTLSQTKQCRDHECFEISACDR